MIKNKKTSFKEEMKDLLKLGLVLFYVMALCISGGLFFGHAFMSVVDGGVYIIKMEKVND